MPLRFRGVVRAEARAERAGARTRKGTGDVIPGACGVCQREGKAAVSRHPPGQEREPSQPGGFLRPRPGRDRPRPTHPDEYPPRQCAQSAPGWGGRGPRRPDRDRRYADAHAVLGHRATLPPGIQSTGMIPALTVSAIRASAGPYRTVGIESRWLLTLNLSANSLHGARAFPMLAGGGSSAWAGYDRGRFPTPCGAGWSP